MVFSNERARLNCRFSQNLQPQGAEALAQLDTVAQGSRRGGKACGAPPKCGLV